MEIVAMGFRGKQSFKRKSWAISVFTEPRDIMRYSRTTMRRLEREFYKNRKGNRTVVITDILSKLALSRSTKSIDEHKGID